MEERMEFALKALKTDNFRALCQEYGISAKTGYKWRERLLQHGLAGFGELSRRPRSSPEQLPEREVCEMIRLKQKHRFWGPRKIRAVYLRLHGQAASESSFKRVLARAGLTEPRRPKRSAAQSGILRTGRQAQGVNDVWTVDFKGWWYDGQSQRCEPLTVRDEHSRYVLELQRLPDARTQTVRARFEKLFTRHGLPRAIRSDNGAPFAQVQGILGLSRLSAWWVALGIELERGRPGHPQDNSAHERMHRDVARELEPHTGEQAALDVWRQEFNWERPHESLGDRFPGEVYRDSERRYPGTPEDLEYEGMVARKVNKIGWIRWQGEPYFIGTSLAGWSVGLKPTAESLWEVWFGRLLLGWLDESALSFQRADIRPLEAGQSENEV
jgi:transposase InsO family protein